MRFHAVQTNPIWEQPIENRAAIAQTIAVLAPERDDFLVLPELCETGFTMNSALAANDDSVAWWSNLALIHRVWLQCGIARRQANGEIANTATIFDPSGNEVGHYCKTFLFTQSGEQHAYCRGSGPKVFDCGGIRIAPMICYDLRFPELWRHAGLEGAEVFTLGACWPAARLAQKHSLITARALENQAWVVAVNRTGDEPKTSYAGGSTIVDFVGITHGVCGNEVGTLTHSIDIDALRTFRESSNTLSDIQPRFLGR
ncbi:MAG: hypothetical protein EXS17_00495 [Phycisphaerales bacterium]|nr:hypothetical protein [Phycisphaerales bacterium]